VFLAGEVQRAEMRCVFGAGAVCWLAGSASSGDGCAAEVEVRSDVVTRRQECTTRHPAIVAAVGL
jgi:hypothetical protein